MSLLWPVLEFNPRWKLALVDLDGTLYRGSAPIEGAGSFIERLRAKGVRPILFTNNATRTPEEVCAHVAAFGIKVHPDDVCTSAQAAAHWMASRYPNGSRIAMLGRGGLRDALAQMEFQPIHVEESIDELESCVEAVVGLDVNATYETLSRLCAVASRVGHFVLTNGDVRLPVEGTFKPGNGALGAFVQTATELTPYIAGKPNADFVRYALERYRVVPEEAIVVGDNLWTDIAAGNSAGVFAIWVQSGVKYGDEQVSNSEYSLGGHGIVADYTCDSVASLFLES